MGQQTNINTTNIINQTIIQPVVVGNPQAQGGQITGPYQVTPGTVWHPLGVTCQHPNCSMMAYKKCDIDMTICGKQFFKGCGKPMCITHMTVDINHTHSHGGKGGRSVGGVSVAMTGEENYVNHKGKTQHHEEKVAKLSGWHCQDINCTTGYNKAK